MFDSKLDRKPATLEGISARTLGARNAAAHSAQQAAHSAQRAAQQAAQSAAQATQAAAQSAAASAGSAAQSAADEVKRSVRGGVHTARGWAAPQLESAADYTTETLAPRVAGALRSTARQVRPPARKPSALTISLLAASAVAALGAAAAIVVLRQKYKAAMDADTESDVMDIEDKDEPAPETTSADAIANA